jgi:hypothetical protein
MFSRFFSKNTVWALLWAYVGLVLFGQLLHSLPDVFVPALVAADAASGLDSQSGDGGTDREGAEWRKCEKCSCHTHASFRHQGQKGKREAATLVVPCDECQICKLLSSLSHAVLLTDGSCLGEDHYWAEEYGSTVVSLTLTSPYLSRGPPLFG